MSLAVATVITAATATIVGAIMLVAGGSAVFGGVGFDPAAKTAPRRRDQARPVSRLRRSESDARCARSRSASR